MVASLPLKTITPKSSPLTGAVESFCITMSGAEPAPVSVEVISNIVPVEVSVKESLLLPTTLFQVSPASPPIVSAAVPNAT